MQKEVSWDWDSSREHAIDIKNKGGYVPSAIDGSKKGWWLKNQHFK